MKLLQIVTRSDVIGGAQKYIIDTSIHYTDLGHKVIVASGGNGPLVDKLKSHGIEHINITNMKREISLFDDFKCILNLRGVFTSVSPDVVFIHSAKSGLLCRLSLFQFSSKLYFFAHGWSHIRVGNFFSKFIYSFLEFFLSFFCNKVICISKADYDYAIDELKLKRDKINLIYNGVKHPKLLGQSHINENLNNNNIYNFLTITRFQSPKDFSTLLESLIIVKEFRTDWMFTVAGDGPELAFYKQKVNECGLSNNISFVGFKKDLHQLYSNADVVFLISLSEGLPLSLVEAMSHKKFLVASDVGGISELIDDGKNGFLIPPYDSTYLSTKIINILGIKKSDLVERGQYSYSLYKSKFTFELMIEKLDKLLMV